MPTSTDDGNTSAAPTLGAPFRCKSWVGGTMGVNPLDEQERRNDGGRWVYAYLSIDAIDNGSRVSAQQFLEEVVKARRIKDAAARYARETELGAAMPATVAEWLFGVVCDGNVTLLNQHTTVEDAGGVSQARSVGFVRRAWLLRATAPAPHAPAPITDLIFEVVVDTTRYPIGAKRSLAWSFAVSPFDSGGELSFVDLDGAEPFFTSARVTLSDKPRGTLSFSRSAKGTHDSGAPAPPTTPNDMDPAPSTAAPSAAAATEPAASSPAPVAAPQTSPTLSPAVAAPPTPAPAAAPQAPAPATAEAASAASPAAPDMAKQLAELTQLVAQARAREEAAYAAAKEATAAKLQTQFPELHAHAMTPGNEALRGLFTDGNEAMLRSVQNYAATTTAFSKRAAPDDASPAHSTHSAHDMPPRKRAAAAYNPTQMGDFWEQ